MYLLGLGSDSSELVPGGESVAVGVITGVLVCTLALVLRVPGGKGVELGVITGIMVHTLELRMGDVLSSSIADILGVVVVEAFL